MYGVRLTMDRLTVAVEFLFGNHTVTVLYQFFKCQHQVSVPANGRMYKSYAPQKYRQTKNDRDTCDNITILYHKRPDLCRKYSKSGQLLCISVSQNLASLHK